MKITYQFKGLLLTKKRIHLGIHVPSIRSSAYLLLLVLLPLLAFHIFQFSSCESSSCERDVPLLLLWTLKPRCHVLILIHIVVAGRCGSWLKWILACSTRRRIIGRWRIVNLNKLAAIVTALSMSTRGPTSTILGKRRHSMLLLYLGCVRLALRIRRPC